MRLTTREGWWRFAEVMAERVPFRTSGALYSSVGGAHVGGASRLPREYWDVVAGADYVVFSYSTPIAWLNCDGSWTVPDVRYSVTTSRHQGKIGTAVADIEAHPGKYV